MLGAVSVAGVANAAIPGGPELPGSGGGLAQTAPKIYVVFWDWTSDPFSAHDDLISLVQHVGNTPWLDTLAQYGAGTQANIYQNYWNDSSTAPTNPTGTQIGQEALNAAYHFVLAQSINSQIVVALPPTVTCRSSFHSAGYDSHYSDVPFQGLFYASCDGSLNVYNQAEGHELAEAMTDPIQNSWNDPSGGGYNEVGDHCGTSSLLPNYVNLNGTNFWMQPLYSNILGDCTFGTTITGGPPTAATTIAGTSSGTTNAYVAVNANLNGVAGFGWLEYGTTASYGTSTYTPFPAGNNDLFSYQFPNATPGTSYHYRMHVSDANGATVTADQTFVVNGVGPAYTSAQPGVGNTIVYGAVFFDPSTSGTVTIAFGATTGYGSSSPALNVTADSTGRAIFSYESTGLTPGTTYHYQVRISSSGGYLDAGPDQTFVAQSS
jgi:hypothetical protein